MIALETWKRHECVKMLAAMPRQEHPADRNPLEFSFQLIPMALHGLST
jgi:hypothetical protein